jgi:glycosyltransferase involved in cell wall biosynthesis
MSSYRDWERGIRNRNYFILQELLKRSEVERIIAVDYLPVMMRKKVKYLIQKLKIKNQNVIQNAKLNLVSGLKLKKINNNLKTLIANYPATSAGRQLPITIIWSYFPLYINYFDDIKADLKIFDAVDDWSWHPVYRKRKHQLLKNYKTINKKADIVFTVSQQLKDSLFRGHKNAFWIPNAIDSKIIETKNKKYQVNKKQKTKNKKLIIGYVGTIQSRVDFKLIRYLAEHHQGKEFMFIGPVWKDAEIDEVKGLSNIKFVGRVPYKELPKYLSKFDLGIIPHKVDQFTKSMNPMKFYEYLAFGLPVVSTQKIVKDKDLLYWAGSYDDFSRAIEQALTENNQELIKKRQSFAKENSWKRRVEEMMNIVKHNIKDSE